MQIGHGEHIIKLVLFEYLVGIKNIFITKRGMYIYKNKNKLCLHGHLFN